MSPSETLVPPSQCAKCANGLKWYDSHGYHCGYIFRHDHSRLSLHPEGLTAECQEFEPKQRTHRYQAPRR